MVRFSKEYPAQYFDVAIAEQHAVTLAAGFACEGLKPVVAIYSSFLQRAYDQLIHDVALQNLPVLFAIDRAGIVGADGETHQGAYDLSFMRCIPNMVIMAPSDTNECRQMLYTGYQCNQPVAVRYPRGSAGTCEVESTMSAIEIGKARSIKQGSKVAILSFGTLLENAKVAAEALNATVIDMRFIKPLDTDAISELLNNHDVIVTLEDNAIAGGAGSAVNEYLAAIKANVTILNLGIPDEFIKHGTQDEMHAEMGLDANGILTRIKEFMA
jgi:1-deoxy-D-xylulose-5-phosphate synthase